MKLGVVMDPIESINFKKDSTLAMMLEAQAREHQLFYMTPNSLYLNENGANALANTITVKNDPMGWFEFNEEKQIRLSELDVILMRQDPPFDMNFINNTYVLEAAENEGLKVVNRPSSLRTFNEKLSILNYPSFITDTLVTSKKSLMEEFINIHKKVVIKPLGLMGGDGVQIVNTDNCTEVLNSMPFDSSEMLMLQKFIDDVYLGDRRILIINGNLPESVVLRKPPEGDFRGNLAIGGTATTETLNERDKEIASVIGKDLLKQGIFIAGLDVVGGFLTEINITCPTCFRELLDQTGENLAKSFVDQLEIIKI